MSQPEPDATPGTDAPASSGGVSIGDFVQQLMGFNAVFWIANTMEMFERLAYYGLRTVLPVYMVLSVEQGGPQFDHVQKGVIYANWALVQSGLPIFTGGYADRYGYKLTVAIAIAIKIAGYLAMAYAVDMAAMITGGASAGVAGHPTTYAVFMVGALLLAAGTAIFKPGLQGIIALQLKAQNASLGWSLFYQLVNVGGFLGPFLAGWMRLLAWKYVFIACAAIVAVNYVFLFVFAEPSSGAPEKASPKGPVAWVLDVLATLWKSFIGICEPRLLAFLVVFSGFWMMFHQLFDLLPNFIDDWVDSSGVLAAVAPVMGAVGIGVPEEWGGNLPQEYMINLNAGMCMLLAFVIGYFTGKVRSMTAMIGGILLASAAIYGLGISSNGWVVLAAIAFFSLGELSASPTKMRYFANIAPPGKKGLYLGYINATNGIGWYIGSLIAGSMYEESGDKVVLARKHLVEAVGMAPGKVEELPKDDVLPLLANELQMTAAQVQELLWATYEPQHVWAYFASIGILSMVGLIVYDQITRRNLAQEAGLLLVLTVAVSWICYSWAYALAFGGLMVLWLALDRFWPAALMQDAQVDEAA